MIGHFLIILFRNILFLEERLVCMAALGYLPKLKKDLGIAFGAHVLYVSFHENVPYLILY